VLTSERLAIPNASRLILAIPSPPRVAIDAVSLDAATSSDGLLVLSRARFTASMGLSAGGSGDVGQLAEGGPCVLSSAATSSSSSKMNFGGMSLIDFVFEDWKTLRSKRKSSFVRDVCKYFSQAWRNFFFVLHI
jgi:hypothetical protein